MELDEVRRVHLIGAGGIGLSALGKLFLAQGKTVTASDMKETSVSKDLASAGAVVSYEQSGHIPSRTELVVYSDAVPFENPERVSARELNIQSLSYAEALGMASRRYRTIAVSGTNGKSTTTSMIGLILEAAGFDPTVVVGSKVPTWPFGNLRIGKSDWLVVEADDYHAHLLHLRPEVIVLTNIEEEHLDYFKNLDEITDTFQQFVDSLPEDGTLVLNADDPVSTEDIKPHANTVTYGEIEEANYRLTGVSVGEGKQSASVVRAGETLGVLDLLVPGQFNRSNALAAAACCLQLGVPFATIAATLASFRGIWRRFEKVGVYNNAHIISDYGHHPSAVRVTLQAARDFYPNARIVLAFEPHQRHRTRALMQDFAACFDAASVVLLADIYDVAGREEASDAVTSEMLAESARARPESPEVAAVGNLAAVEAKLKEIIRPGDVVIIMGAGGIDRVARNLVP